jgi:hypothetical protein
LRADGHEGQGDQVMLRVKQMLRAVPTVHDDGR